MVHVANECMKRALAEEVIDIEYSKSNNKPLTIIAHAVHMSHVSYVLCRLLATCKPLPCFA